MCDCGIQLILYFYHKLLALNFAIGGDNSMQWKTVLLLITDIIYSILYSVIGRNWSCKCDTNDIVTLYQLYLLSTDKQCNQRGLK